VVRTILSTAGADIKTLIGNSPLLRALRPEQFVTDTVGLPTVTDILRELDKPGRDPRPEFTTATFAEGVEKIADLKPGMALEGVVTNVTNFGAFVDVGVHQDGLVHVSELSNRFVSDPNQVVKAGQIVKVKVLSADPNSKRISLSIKALEEPREACPKAARPEPRKPTLQEQIAKLNDRFRTR
jgi:uncharacterized protein